MKSCSLAPGSVIPNLGIPPERVLFAEFTLIITKKDPRGQEIPTSKVVIVGDESGILERILNLTTNTLKICSEHP
jgi:hypothetical protein